MIVNSFETEAYAQVRASFGEGKGPIFLDNLNCIGNETMLLNCKNDGVGFHNCLHTEDSSVICKGIYVHGTQYNNQDALYTVPMSY